jgi:hypothetical protein
LSHLACRSRPTIELRRSLTSSIWSAQAFTAAPLIACCCMLASARASLRLVCRSRRDCALSYLLISEAPLAARMPPVHGCPVTLPHGWEQLHIRVSGIPASATTCLTTWPHHCLPGRPSANDAPVFQRPTRPNVARVVRVSVALAVYGGLDFIISKWASYFSCRSLICNPLMSLRSHCS